MDESALLSLVELVGGEDMLKEFGLDSSIMQESVNKTFNSLSNVNQRKLQQIADKLNKKADLLESRRIDNNKGLNEEYTNMSNREKFYEVDLQSLREAIEMEKAGLEDADYNEAAEEEPSDEMADIMNEIRLILDLGEEVEAEDLPEMLRGMVEEDEAAEGADVELEDPEGAEQEDEDPDAPAPAADDEDVPMEDIFGDAGEAEDLNEVFEIDPVMLRQELARVKRLVNEGKVDHHFGGKGDGKVGVDGAYGGKGNKNAGVSSAFGGGKEGQDAFTNPPQINKLNEAIRQLRRQNRAQSEKLNKYRGAINTLREQLEDLNLFNAKLLYVNKLLQTKGLTESQKKSVIKALDEAQTLNETKALYKSLTESLTSSRSTLNESARYGSSSRTTTSASSRKDQSSDLGRWQKLAGLK